jgi:hypothetical protein
MALLQNTDFDYKVQRLSSLPDAVFDPFFSRLPRDPYIEGHFRRRRFSRFKGHPERLTRLEHKFFVQSTAVNKLAGGVKRDFEELEDGLIARHEFQDLVSKFIDFSKIEPVTTEVGIHQIRVVASPDEQGEPAPEGIHQDGFDFVGIFCIRRSNLIGAETHLYEDPEKPPIFAKELQPGEFVLVNDRRLFHYTSALYPQTSGEGVRDVFVMTA